MTTYAFLGALAIMGALVAFLSWLQHKERTDLYNRIQAGTLSEYQQATGEKAPPPKGRSLSAKVMEREKVDLP